MCGFLAKGNGDIQSLRLRLCSGLRQGGDRFAAAFYGTAEAVPFRVGDGCWIYVVALKRADRALRDDLPYHPTSKLAGMPAYRR